MTVDRHDALSETSHVTDPRFVPLAARFDEIFDRESGIGAQLCVYSDGEPVVDLSTERPGAVQVIRSASKAIVALVAAILHDQSELDVDAPIADLWPEFAANGKERITTRTVLAHQAGLPVFDRIISPTEALQWECVTEQLARQEPRWCPGTAHGYHDLTFGWLVGEVVRRATGETIGEVVQRDLSDRLGLDLWVGTPLTALRRIRQIRRTTTTTAANSPDLARKDLLALEMMSNPDLDPLENSIEYLRAEIPAGNAVTDARSLARLFAASVGEVDSVSLLSTDGLRQAIAPQSEGPDAVVGWDRRYASGFMLPEPTRPLGGIDTESFGHYGRGVAMVFAEPELRLSFAFLTSTEQLHFGTDPVTTELGSLAVHCARA